MSDKRDGIYKRADSPYWWTTLPNRRGGTSRCSLRIRVCDDPQGTEALKARTSALAATHVERTGERATFDDLISLYLEQVTPTKKDTERDKWSAKALYPVFTGRYLAEIKGHDIRSYITARTDQGIAPGTLNHEIGLMSAAITWAQRELEWEVDNPWKSRRQTEPEGRDRWLTPDEAQRLLAAAQANANHPWIADFIELGLYTGMRPGEILGLTWDRVSFDNAVIHFDIGDQKSGRRGRIPVNATARAVLSRRRHLRAEHHPGSVFVLCRKNGRKIDSIQFGFQRCVEAARLTDVHPHDLRRTFGSWLIQAGIGIERVSALLRHSDVSITARVYAHLRPSDLADASAILDQRENQHITPERNRPDQSIG